MAAPGTPVDLDAYRIRPGEAPGLAGRATRADGGGDREALDAETTRLLAHVSAMQERLYAESRQSLLVVVQAMDGGGKDSTIQSVFGPLNPQGVHTVPFKAPSSLERSHDFLWRVHQRVPAQGEIVVFNRSHYEDVLIGRVRALAPPDVIERRYDHITAFERLLEDSGTRIVKVMLHVSPAYQLERLQKRLADPEKHWKFNPGDLAERRLWPAYMEAFEVALARTSTDSAPWFVVPAEYRPFRDLVVAQIVADAMDAMDPQYPAPTFDPADYPPDSLV